MLNYLEFSKKMAKRNFKLSTLNFILILCKVKATTTRTLIYKNNLGKKERKVHQYG